MNDFNIDEMMEAAAYVEWKMVMKITAEQEAQLLERCDGCEIVPKAWFHDNGSIFEQSVEIYKINTKNNTYELWTIALYATDLKSEKTNISYNLFTNYQVIKEILRRLGANEDFLTREKWDAICHEQLNENLNSQKEDKKWNKV